MPSWNDLLNDFAKQPNDDARTAWVHARLQDNLGAVGTHRGGRNVIFYASAFLNKPQAGPYDLQLTYEEINGFMSVMYGMNWDNGLTLMLHTPGGMTNAAETIVSYLHSKFEDIEVIIPTFAMSAGTMIALASNRLIMGRQSQLGPIDPQIPIGARTVSARAIVDQFERARKELGKDLTNAHLWAPILQTLGPAVLQEAQNALDYGQRMVRGWLVERMFKGKPDGPKLAKHAASYFSKGSLHKSHGRRIDRDEARSKSIEIEDLEDSQDLQEAVLTAYHLATISFEKSPATKFLVSNYGRVWVKNILPPVPGPRPPQPGTPS